MANRSEFTAHLHLANAKGTQAARARSTRTKARGITLGQVLRWMAFAVVGTVLIGALVP